MPVSGGAESALRQVAQRAKSLPRLVVEQATTDLRQAALRPLRADTGGDGALSGAGNVQLKVTRRVTGKASVVSGVVSAGSPRAQWYWLEFGTKPHMVGRRRHPGARAKRTWSRGVDPAVRQVLSQAQTKLGSVVSGRGGAGGIGAMSGRT